MLSIKKLTPRQGNGAAYYTDLASTDLAAYYAGSGEAPGHWIGSGLDELCADLGIDPINAGDIMDASGIKLFEYLNSKEAMSALFPPQRQPAGTDGQWVSGYDLTFSAPKGISMLAVMTDNDDLRRAIYEAHEQTVRQVMAAIEDYICFGREGKGGINLVKGSGIIAGSFRHRTARPAEDGDIPDPHLHTHVVIANIVRHPDGTYGALDGRALIDRGLRLGPMGTRLYGACLQDELSKRGVYLEWKTTGPTAQLEVAGIPDDLLTAFSSRHNQILTELEKAGLSSSRAANIAQRKTRRAKDREIAAASDKDLSGKLQAKLCQMTTGKGQKRRLATLADLHGALHRNAQTRQATGTELDKIAARLVRPLASFVKNPDGIPAFHLTAHHSTFTFADACEALSQIVRTAQPKEIMAAARRLLDSQGVIALTPDEPSGATLPGRQRYTTPEILELERSVVTMALHAKASKCGIVHHPLDIVGLSSEQANMCKQLTGAGNTVDVVVGVAGSGKTYALGRCRAAWEKDGYTVIGCAKSARATAELESGSGIKSSTIDRLIFHLSRGKGLPKGCVVVVDEAGMVGTRELVKLARHVDTAKGKLVLVGDHRQLGAVDAGGLFGHLATSSPSNVVTLTENRRNERDAALLAKLRQGGNTSEIVTQLTDTGMLQTFDDTAGAAIALCKNWNVDRLAGKNTVMVAYSRQDVAMLNAVARLQRIEAGEIDGGTQIGENTFSVGDRVVALQNRYHLRTGDSIVNGERGMVAKIDKDAVTILTDAGSVKQLPMWYAEKHLALGYALTIHKSQGMTADTVHVLGSDQLYREAAYVAMSRSRKDTHLYMVASDPLAFDPEGTTHGHELGETRTAEQRLSGILARSGNDVAASTVAKTPPAVSPTLAVSQLHWIRTKDGQWGVEGPAEQLKPGIKLISARTGHPKTFIVDCVDATWNNPLTGIEMARAMVSPMSPDQNVDVPNNTRWHGRASVNNTHSLSPNRGLSL